MQRGRSDDTSRIAERAWRGSKAVGGRWLGRPSNSQGDWASPGHSPDTSNSTNAFLELRLRIGRTATSANPHSRNIVA